MKKIKIHKDKKVETKKINNVLKTIYVVAFYITSIYILECQYQLSLFVKLALLYGLMTALKHVNKL